MSESVSGEGRGRIGKGHARRQAVVAAATQAISDLGFANVRVSDIAERADMTPGHVTYYFPSKTDLLMLAIRRSEEALVDHVAAELELIGDPWSRLRRLIELSAASGRSDTGWILWFQVWADAASNDAVADVHNELDERWRSILSDVLTYGKLRGVFRFDDLSDTTQVISALIVGLSVQLTVGAPGVDRARMLRLCDTVCRSILSPPSILPN